MQNTHSHTHAHAHAHAMMLGHPSTSSSASTASLPYPTASNHAAPLPPQSFASHANPHFHHQQHQQHQHHHQHTTHNHQGHPFPSLPPPFQQQTEQQPLQQQPLQHPAPPTSTIVNTTTPSDLPSGVPLPPAYREKVQQLKAILLDRKNWKICRGTPTSSHKVPPGEFDAGELVCRNCKQHDPKFFLEPDQADAKIKELLATEPCHFVPRYDQAGCGVDRDRPNYDSKDWTTWALKPNSRGTVLRERLWQCCLGGGRKAAAKYKAGQAKNTTKIGCPRSLYAVTRWDAQEQAAKLVEIYFKHKHLPECYEHASASARTLPGAPDE